MMTDTGLGAFDVAMFALRQLDFVYRPLSLDDPHHESQLYSLTNQLDRSINFLTTTALKQQKSKSNIAMFVYSVSSLEEDPIIHDETFDDTCSTSSASSDENDSTELQDAIRSGFTGVIDFSTGEMTLYPPSHSTYLHKESIINLMDIAECICCSKMYICIEKHHQEMKEFARGFIYAGFELVQPKVKSLSSNDWILFGAEL